MLHKDAKSVTPRALIMSLLNAPDRSTLSIGQLIRAGSLFEIEATTTRMAVTRLIKAELISSAGRGVYREGRKAASLRKEIQSWRTANKKMKAWNGDWIIALTNHLGRTDKTQLRSMIRAFTMYGFVEIELGVWVRPANLVLSIDDFHRRLVGLGMDGGAYLMTLNAIAGEHKNSWRGLWPVVELEFGYANMIHTMDQSLNSLKTMSDDEAARESLIVGESAIRLINLDPLLPPEMINTELFDALVKKMIEYDQVGIVYWQRFLSSETNHG